MSSKTWLAVTPTSQFDIGLTMADVMRDLDPGWERTFVWYAEDESAPMRAAVA